MPGHQDLAARLIAVDLDVVVVDLRRRVETEDTTGRQPPPGNQALQHRLGIGKDALRFAADHRVIQDRRK